MSDAYARLKTRFARIATLGEAGAMLHWDASAMMPPGGGAARGEQLAVLAGLGHELLTAPAVAEDLAAAAATGDWDQANLRLMRRAHLRATALPTTLVEATARANAACERSGARPRPPPTSPWSARRWRKWWPCSGRRRRRSPACSA